MEALEAGFWGFVGGAALLVGAVIGLYAGASQRVISIVMAVGAGVLISSVAFELMEESYEKGGFGAAAAGLVAGAVLYFAADWAVSRGAKNRKRSQGQQEGGSGTAIAIVALPPALAGRIAYDPPLPARRDLLSQRMPHGAVVKFAAVYDEPFWRRQGLNGQAASDAGPVAVTFDGSPPGGDPGILVGYVNGRHAVELGEVSPVQRRNAVLGCLRRFFGGRASVPIEYLDLDWNAEEWTRGCYGGNASPGALTAYGPALRAPVGPLNWAGSETAREWVGYMEGAIEVGERAAREVVTVLADQRVTPGSQRRAHGH